MKKSLKFWLTTLCFLFWIILVVSSFLYRFPVKNLVEVLLNGMMLGILLLVFTALGRRIGRSSGITFSNFAEECCMAFGLGSGLLMLLIFVLAVAGLLYEILILPLMLALCLLVYRDARELCVQGYQAALRFFLREKSLAESFFLLLMVCAGTIAFLAAATPPFFFDALVYHVAVPHKYLLLHGFHYIPHQPFSNLAMNFGMLSIAAMSFSKGMLVKLLSWAYLPLSAFAVYGFAKSRWGDRIALTSAAIMFLIPACLILSTLTAIDCVVMFYSFLCVFALLSWSTSHNRLWLIWSALFCSVAIGVKYQAIVVTFAPAVLLVLIHECYTEKHSLFRGGQKVFFFSVIVLCGISPWLVKNFLYTSNPLYPFFNSLFGSQTSYNVEYSELMRRVGNPIHTFIFSLIEGSAGNLQNWLEGIFTLIKVPWFFTMRPYGAAAKIGIVFLLYIPLIVVIKHLDRTTKYLLICALTSLWLWALFLPWVQRYGFPVLPLLSLITAYILWNLPVSHIMRKSLVGLLCIGLSYQLLMFMVEEVQILRPFGYLFANQTREAFLLDHGVNYYPVIQYVNRETPANAKILFVGESRGYYCERDYLLYTVIEGIDDKELPLRNLIIQSQDIHNLLQKLRSQGITHLLINASEMKRYTETYLARDSYLGLPTAKDQKIFRDLLSPQFTRELITSHQVRLYEILFPRE